MTEHGETTMRWNRSRWVPSAWATAALMGSAWDTATIGLAGVAAHSAAMASVMRGLHPGERLAAGEAELAGAALHGLPLGQLRSALELRAGPVAEVALEQARCDVAPAAPQALAMGAAVSRVRSSGDAYTAVDRPSCADALGHRLGLGVTRLGEVQPAGAAGQHLAGGRGLAVADQQDQCRLGRVLVGMRLATYRLGGQRSEARTRTSGGH